MAANVRTDLALEAHEAYGAKPPRGVRVTEERPEEGILVTRVHVLSAEGAKALGKPEGHYVTIESRRLRHHDREHAMVVGKVLSRELEAMVRSSQPETVLVVGLGNWNATPDSLGPKVVGRVLVTRHLQGVLPDDLKGRLRSVAALAPGVLGLTGVETSEIVRGMVERVEPGLVVAIDALAAAHIERILTTIQVADTGIHPGSGVGNHRSGLTEETLGCPVIAVGVPTVVHATTIAEAALDALVRTLNRDPAGELARALDDLDRDEVLQRSLTSSLGELMVTPKEIDVQVEDLSRLIAGAVNTCLHPGIDLGEFSLYT
jgi:spore protease